MYEIIVKQLGIRMHMLQDQASPCGSRKSNQKMTEKGFKCIKENVETPTLQIQNLQSSTAESLL